MQEQRLRPGPRAWRIVAGLGPVPPLGLAAKYFPYRFHARELQQALGAFAGPWRRPSASTRRPIGIHVDGDAYKETCSSVG